MLTYAMRSTAVLLLLLPAVTHAQAWDAKALKKPNPPPPAPKSGANGMKACPEYGAGFYRLDSGTCVRISGGISADVGVSGTRR